MIVATGIGAREAGAVLLLFLYRSGTMDFRGEFLQIPPP